jgi:hypothetical protein
VAAHMKPAEADLLLSEVVFFRYDVEWRARGSVVDKVLC